MLNVFNFKGLWLTALILLSIVPAWAVPFYWVGPSGAQIWSGPQNWSFTSGGSGGAGVPGLGDDAIFDSNGAGDCVVDIADPVVGSLSFETGFGGLFDVGGNTLHTQSITNLQTRMQNGVVEVLGGKILIQTSDLAIALIGITDDLNLLTNTIQNVTLTVTGSVLNSVTGNTFTSSTSFTRTGTGVLYFASNSFQGVVMRNQNDTGEILCEGTETYNANANFTNDAKSGIKLAHAGGHTVYNNGAITFSNIQNGTISIGLGGGTATLENFANLRILDSGTGTVSLNNLTVNGTYNPALTVLTGTTVLHLANCTFNSPFFQSLPRITCGIGNQFNSEFTVQITGDQPSTISGTFSAFFSSYIWRSGSGDLALDSNNFLGYLGLSNSNNSGSIIGRGNEVYTNVDVFNGADSPINLAHSGGSTSFRGQVRFSNNQNGTISIGLGGGTATLENFANLRILDSGTGTVSLNNLTVNGTYNPVNTILTGTTHLHLANCTFNSGFSQVMPRITCGTGNQFNNQFLAEVTGNQASNISAIFNQTADITRNGTGNLSISSSNFIDNAIVTNESTMGSLELSQNTFN